MFSIDASGDFPATTRFLEALMKPSVFSQLDGIAKQGVAALRAATPVRTGVAANSWSYEVVQANGSYSIYWTNSDVENGFPVAVMLQYGHGTGNGGYVTGRDYINPAMRPIFDQMAERAWKVVISA